MNRQSVIKIAVICILLFIVLPISFSFYSKYGTLSNKAKKNNITSISVIDNSIPKDIVKYVDARLNEYYNDSNSSNISKVSIKDNKIYNKDTGYYFYITNNSFSNDRIDIDLSGFNNDVRMYVNGFILLPQATVEKNIAN